MPEAKRDFNKDAATWDDNPLRRQLGEALGSAIKAALPLTGTETVMDYGAGTGLVSLALCSVAGRVLAADSSPGMLEVLAAKAKAAGITNIEARLLDLELPSAQAPAADAVVSSMALHHVDDVRRMAGVFFQLLPGGGRVAMADLATEAGDFHADNTGVRHFGFDPDWLRAAFSDAGFAQVQVGVAHTVRKPGAGGAIKDFPVLLLTGVKP